MIELVYLSNGGRIGDGTRITRVWTDAIGVQHFEIMVDAKTGRFAEVIAARSAPTNTPPAVPAQIITGTVEAGQ